MSASVSVSQLEYWKEGTPPNENDKNTGEGEGAIYLSYNVFLGLSVLGGFLGLDHLYLRSPLTFLAKLAVNFMFFGVWWLYDAMQAIFNREVVQLYGLPIPFLGPKGIGAGVLVNDVPDKKHMRFFTYAMALLFGGMIGLDSFMVGNNELGFLRLIGLITLIFAPISIMEWLYKMFKFFTDTKEVTGEYHEYFGAPPGASLKDKALSRFPFLAALFSPMEWIKSMINTLLGPLIEPLKGTAEAAIRTADSAISTVDHTVELGKMAIDKGSTMVGQIANVVTKAADAVSASSSIIPGAALYQTITPESVSKALGADNKAKAAATVGATVGGAMLATELNPLSYILVGTIVLIIVLGFSVTFSRAKQYGSEKNDDSPPEPGVPGKPTEKGRTA
uniref:TM2 domain-containing protein n=1 Tax=viral metagenome TaxID=1070528 RepID=A0A6C0IGT1_9ZZZZ